MNCFISFFDKSLQTKFVMNQPFVYFRPIYRDEHSCILMKSSKIQNLNIRFVNFIQATLECILTDVNFIKRIVEQSLKIYTLIQAIIERVVKNLRSVAVQLEYNLQNKISAQVAIEQNLRFVNCN
jgi:hypothetical protein